MNIKELITAGEPAVGTRLWVGYSATEAEDNPGTIHWRTANGWKDSIDSDAPEHDWGRVVMELIRIERLLCHCPDIVLLPPFIDEKPTVKITDGLEVGHNYYKVGTFPCPGRFLAARALADAMTTARSLCPGEYVLLAGYGVDKVFRKETGILIEDRRYDIAIPLTEKEAYQASQAIRGK